MKLAYKTALDFDQLSRKSELGQYAELFTRVGDAYNGHSWELLKSFSVEVLQVHAPRVDNLGKKLKYFQKKARDLGARLLVHEWQLGEVEEQRINKKNLVVENSPKLNLDDIFHLALKYDICFDLEHVFENLGYQTPGEDILKQMAENWRLFNGWHLGQTYADYLEEFPLNEVFNRMHLSNCNQIQENMPLQYEEGLIDIEAVLKTLQSYNFPNHPESVIVIETPTNDNESMLYAKKWFGIQ